MTAPLALRVVVAQWGHGAARVQRIQRVQKVQRVWYRPAGDEYEVSVTGFIFVSPLVHADEPQPPFLGRRWRRKRRRIGAGILKKGSEGSEWKVLKIDRPSGPEGS
mgnify:CR=1 FL=1